MALLVFTSDELDMQPFAGRPDTRDAANSTRCLSTTVASLTQADQDDKNNFRCPNVNKDDLQDSTALSYIVLSKTHFQALIAGSPAGAAAIDFEHFKYFAHVRSVNVQGSSHAASSDNPDDHPFGVVVSHRTGPADATESRMVFVHLISLDGIAENLNARPLAAGVDRVGLVSLYAWTYRVAPNDPISYVDLLNELNRTMQPLRRPDPLITSIEKGKGGADSSAQWLCQRLRLGYTFVQHRTLSGEKTVGLYRGPLTPQKTVMGACPPSDSGKDLQRLDSQAGAMDLTYCIAWELGRTLAMADKGFTTAIMRLRTEIHALAVKGTSTKKSYTFTSLGNIKRNQDQTLGSTTVTKVGDSFMYSGPRRWTNTARDEARVKQSSQSEAPAGEAVILRALEDIVRPWLTSMAKAQAQRDKDSGGANVNDPARAPVEDTSGTARESGNDGEKDQSPGSISANWTTVLRWVKAKMALQGIPYIYFFPDPAVLPTEALRTFYIDDNWISAFIDGALSVANHLIIPVDPVKREIRKSINVYLSELPPSMLSWLPAWGLVMRSHVVATYPNLQIEQSPTPPKTSTLQQSPPAFKQLAEDTLIYFQQFAPEDTPGGKALLITQPFHHHRFSVGEALNGSKLEFSFKLFTSKLGGKDKEEAERRIELAKNLVELHPDTTKVLYEYRTEKDGQIHNVPLASIYNWQTRCINITAFLQACKDVNNAVLRSDLWDSLEDTSGYIGIQFNDALLQLHLKYPNLSSASSSAVLGDTNSPTQARIRGLYDPPPDVAVTKKGAPTDTEAGGDTTTSKENTLATAPGAGAVSGSGDDDDSSRLAPFRVHPDSNLHHPSPKPALLPAPRGFRIPLLGDAVPCIPHNDPSYNNLKPIITSQLAKICYPLLACPKKNFPAGSPVKLDIVLSVKAIRDVRQDLFLRSMTVHIPCGNVNTNLLLLPRARPRVRMVGPGRQWVPRLRVTKGKQHRINLDGSWMVDDAVGDQDQQYLSVTVTPFLAGDGNNTPQNAKEGSALHLLTYPDVSLVLYEMQINPLPCERIPLLLEERYWRGREDKGFHEAGTVRNVVAVTKQLSEWR
jgi:hypothetical protein